MKKAKFQRLHKVWTDNRWITTFLNSYITIPVHWHKKNSFFDHSSFSCLPVFFLCMCISQYKLDFVAVTNNPISMALKQQSLFLIYVVIHGVLARVPLITATMRSQQVDMPRRKRFLGVLCVLEITHITSAHDSLVRTIQRLYPTTMKPRVTVLPRVQKGNQEYLLSCIIYYHSLLNSNSHDKECNWLHLTMLSFTLQLASLLAGGEREIVYFIYVWEHGMDDEDGKTIQGSQAKQIIHNI